MNRGGLIAILVVLEGYAPRSIGAELPPLGPDTVPANVIGVVGSGDDLTLQLKDGRAIRSLKIGDSLGNWRITALTASSLTLSRDGALRVIGLNPDGAIASSKPEARSVVMVLPDPALLAEAQRLGIWDGKTARSGLSLDETKSYVALIAKAGGISGNRDGFLTSRQTLSLGEDRGAYLALNDKHLQALEIQFGLPPGPKPLLTFNYGTNTTFSLSAEMKAELDQGSRQGNLTRAISLQGAAGAAD